MDDGMMMLSSWSYYLINSPVSHVVEQVFSIQQSESGQWQCRGTEHPWFKQNQLYTARAIPGRRPGMAGTQSIIHDLIISCNLPLSLINKPSFKNFMSVVEERYCPVSRSTVTRRLSELAADKVQDQIQTRKNRQCVCDCWYLDWPKHVWLFRGNSPPHGDRGKQPKPADSSLKLWTIYRVTHWRTNKWEIWGDIWSMWNTN